MVYDLRHTSVTVNFTRHGEKIQHHKNPTSIKDTKEGRTIILDSKAYKEQQCGQRISPGGVLDEGIFRKVKRSMKKTCQKCDT